MLPTSPGLTSPYPRDHALAPAARAATCLHALPSHQGASPNCSTRAKSHTVSQKREILPVVASWQHMTILGGTDKDAGLSPNWGGQLAVSKILAQLTLAPRR